MIGLAVFILVPCLGLGAIQNKHDIVPGYYWREFSGHVPEDALQGGVDENKIPIYMGQVLYHSFIIPVRIYPNDSTVRFEYSFDEHETKENIKILCTQNPEHFEWVPSDNHKLRLITDKHLVVGGAQEDWTILIGKGKLCNDIIVGKLALRKNPRGTAMYVSHKGNVHILTSFEALAYNPSKTK